MIRSVTRSTDRFHFVGVAHNSLFHQTSTFTDRMNAARARQRTKQQIEDLSTEVDQYAARNMQLQRVNAELVRQVEALHKENALLRQRLSLVQGSGGGLLGALDPTASLHHQLASNQLQQQQQQQHQALLQSLTAGLGGGADVRSLFPGASAAAAQDTITSPTLASLLAQRDSLDQHRLLLQLQQQGASAAALDTSRLLGGGGDPLSSLSAQQRLLLGGDTSAAGGRSHFMGHGSSHEPPATDIQTPLLRALIEQQRLQRDREQASAASDVDKTQAPV